MYSRILFIVFATFVSSANADPIEVPSCDRQFCVGMVLPLSGPVSEYGTAIRNGVSMAQDARPERFKTIRFLYEDSEYKPAKSVSSFKKLVELDRAQLVYTFGGSVSEVVAPIGQQLKVATLISSIDPLAKIGKSYVIRFDNPTSDFGTVLAKELSRASATRVGIVLTENHYLNTLVRGLKESLKSSQSLEVIATFKPDDLDFKSVVTKLRRDTPDALGIFLLPGQVAQFYTELEKQNVNVPSFGSDVFDSTSEIKAAHGAMNGAFLAHHVVTDSFRASYVEKFGNDFQMACAGQGYDLANLLGTLFEDLRRPSTSEEILSRLRGSAVMQGVSGQFEFVRTNHGDEFFQFPVKLKRIQGDQLVVVDTAVR